MLEIDIKPKYGILFVKLNGYLNKHTVNKLKEITLLAKKIKLKNILFNLSELYEIDKYGINELKNNIKICESNNGISILCGINNNISNNLLKSKILNNTYLIENENNVLNIIER